MTATPPRIRPASRHAGWVLVAAAAVALVIHAVAFAPGCPLSRLLFG